MRMWLCDPKIMCNSHLLTEHNELHMLVAMLKQRMRLTEFLKKGWIEPLSIHSRHEELMDEILKRNIYHNTPIYPDEFDIFYLGKGLFDRKINRSLSKQTLLNVCLDCKSRSLI